MTTGASLLGEADLHGLVDGHLAAERRADVLRKLAASPADRALVEAWQEQNDMIRAAFRDVAHETLPVALDLAPPRLRCIDGGIESDPGRPLPPLSLSSRHAPAGSQANGLATFATVLVVGLGLAGTWLAFNPARPDDAPTTAVAAQPASPEASLADRATAALEATPATAASATSPPAVTIPDLGAGLRLTDVSVQAGEPGTLVARYRDPRGARVVLGIAAAEAGAAPAETIGKTLVWRRGGTAYALAGTLPAERLRTLARTLQDEPAKP